MTGTDQRGLPDTCCCPRVFGARITAQHCPVHGSAMFDPDAVAEAHAIDRRNRMKEINDR